MQISYQWVQTASLCSCLNTHTVFSYLGLGFIFFMVFLLYCFASLDDRKEQEMSVSVVMSTSAFYLTMMYFFLASLTLKYNSSILDDINENNDETSSSDYHSMERPTYNSQTRSQYNEATLPTYSRSAPPKRQFSDEYVKDFDEVTKPTASAGVSC